MSILDILDHLTTVSLHFLKKKLLEDNKCNKFDDGNSYILQYFQGTVQQATNWKGRKYLK